MPPQEEVLNEMIYVTRGKAVTEACEFDGFNHYIVFIMCCLDTSKSNLMILSESSS